MPPAHRTTARLATLIAGLWIALAVVPATAAAEVVHRINVGGSALIADSGPDWGGDTDALPSALRTAGADNTFETSNTVALGPGVPAGTPPQLFTTERWHPDGAAPATWALPVPADGDYVLRLYLAEIYDGIEKPGDRIFDIAAEGQPLHTGVDQFALAGGLDVGLVLESTVTVNDGVLDLALSHVEENPALKGIEVLTSGPPPPDTTPPGVVSSIPANGTSEVDPERVLTITFSEELDPTTVDTSSVRIAEQGGSPLDAAVSLDGATVSLTPAAPLAGGVTHDVTLGTAIADLAGNGLPAPLGFSFTTAVPDETAPELLSSEPADGEADIDPTGVIALSFSEPLDPATVTVDTVTLTAVGGGQVPVVLALDGPELTVAPNAPLATETVHTLRLGAAIADPAGNPLTGGPAEITFTTAAGPPPGDALYRINVAGPELPGASGPAWAADTDAQPSSFRTSGAENIYDTSAPQTAGPTIPAGTPLEMFQTERWHSDSAPATWAFPVPAVGDYGVRIYLAEIYDGIENPGDRVFDVTAEGQTIHGEVDQFALAGGRDIGIALDAVVGVDDGVLDLGLSAVAENPAIKGIEILTTGPPPPDTTPPELVQTTPANGATGVDPGAPITVTFSESLDPAGVDGASVSVAPAGGAAVGATVSLEGAVITLEPDAPLGAGVEHEVTLGEGIADLAGNALAAPLGFAFTTAGGEPVDTTPPTLVGSSPADGTTDADPADVVVLTFSEDLDPATVGPAAVELRVQGGPVVASSVDLAGSVVTLTPDGPLDHETAYEVGVAGSISDPAGNTLGDPRTIAFTTASDPATDTTPPGVVSNAPSDGAVDVDAATAITVTFTEAIDPATVTTATVELTADGEPVAASLQIDGATLTVSPGAALAPGTPHVLTLGAGLADPAGNTLAEAPVAIAFTTAQATVAGESLYRVNVGGEALTAPSGPDWEADTDGDPSPTRTGGADNTFETSLPSSAGPDVPVGTPLELFTTERWHPDDGAPATWAFTVPAAGDYTLRLYLAEIYDGIEKPGDRVFDVAVEGQPVHTGVDQFALAGGRDIGLVLESTVTVDDGTLDLALSHVEENPAVKGIEVLTAGPPPSQAGLIQASPRPLTFGTADVGETLERVLTLENLGSAGDPDITITGVAAIGGGGNLSTSAPSPAVIGPGETSSVTVTWSPTSPGNLSATLEVIHSGANSPLTFAARGSAIDPTNPPPVSFDVSDLSGVIVGGPTALQWGPDDRLYIARGDGPIGIHTVERNGPSDYEVTGSETVDLLTTIPNHNDFPGSSEPIPQGSRLVTGMIVTGTATAPRIYATSFDPRSSVDVDIELDTNSGVISRLDKTPGGWVKTDLVRGLPRSEENHGPNGLELSPDGETLYVAVGGNTNRGAPSSSFALLPEYALSAAVLSVDLAAIGDTTYDLPTLNPFPGQGPFGGDDGRNQAKIVPGGPVQVHAPGFRNPYDLVLTRAGELYTVDNGANGGWGDIPAGEGPGGACTNVRQDGGDDQHDALHLITGPGYYGGHPNPVRGNPAGSGFPDAVPAANPVECDHRAPAENGSLATFDQSTNGITEFTSTNFGGQLDGDILTVGFNGDVFRVKPDGNGGLTDLTPGQPGDEQILFSNFGSFPLDITAAGPDDPFPGTVWVGNFGTGLITVFEPSDYDGQTGPACTGADDPALDEDGDSYSNADEIANATDPCSGASRPSDADADPGAASNDSDLLDPDDDNDGIDDTSDPFALDGDNGTSTSLPVSLGFSPGAVPGTLLNAGWTGLMTNASGSGPGSDYLDLFDDEAIIPGGAASVFTRNAVSAGSALGSGNDQEEAFQFGVDTAGAPFAVVAGVASPFPSASVAGRSAGVYLGTGDQDDYVSLAVTDDGSGPGVSLTTERAGDPTAVHVSDPGVVGASEVELTLTVRPAAAGELAITAEYAIDGGAAQAAGTTTVPASWLDGPAWLTEQSTVAVGVIATAGAGPQYSQGWSRLDVVEVAPAASDAAALVEVMPDDRLEASTFEDRSFRVTNDSTAAEITAVRFDLGTAILADAIFDPDGTGGDTTAQPFALDLDPGTTTATLGDPFNGVDGAGGYTSLMLATEGFGPSESLEFHIDVDPASIRGAEPPGPNESGSVSGLELAGSSVTVTFSDGVTRTGRLGPDGSDGGARVALVAGAPPAPSLTLAGSTGPQTFTDPAQIATVTGTPGDTVTLTVVEGGRYTEGVPDGAPPLGSHDLNTLVAVGAAQTATIEASGSVSLPVALTAAGAAGGVNVLIATVANGEGATAQANTVRAVLAP